MKTPTGSKRRALPATEPVAARLATGGMLRLPASAESRLRRRLRPLRRLHGLLQAERRNRARVGLGTRLRALRHGFTSSSWRLYDLDRNDPGEYLPDYPDLDFGDAAIHRVALRDKLLFARAMRGLDAPHAPVLAYLTQGHAVPVTADGGCGGWGEAEVLELLARYGELVVKPVDGGAGFGLLFLSGRHEPHRVNGRALSAAEVRVLVGQLDDAIVTPLVRQHPYAAAIAPMATNTVRVLTVWDWDLGRPFLAAAAHRFATSRVAPVDNFHAGRGGLSVPIDPGDGRMGAALSLGPDGRLRQAPVHPETGAPIEGVIVPFWSRTAALLERLAAGLPEAPYIGWDVVVTEEGPCLLEGNAPPGAMVWQVHGGLLRDPRVRRFFVALGLARPR